jgi:hypothetical protein
MSLDERLEAVAQGVKSINEALEPLMSQTPTVHREDGSTGGEAVILRKHAALMAEWEAARSESETLRDELKEDKWLIVFRTVTEQAGGLMTSLEKGVNRCQVRPHNVPLSTFNQSQIWLGFCYSSISQAFGGFYSSSFTL